MGDNYIIESIIDNRNHIHYGRLKRLLSNDDVIEYLINRYDDCDDPIEAIGRIYHKIDNVPICEECNSKIKFTGSLKRPYNLRFCSKRCSCIYNSKHQTNESIIKANETRNQTNLERYAVENSFCSDIAKQHIKETLYNNYECDHPMHSELIKEKVNNTNVKRYGVSSFTQTNNYIIETQKTNNEKYGCDWYFQSNDFKNKAKETSNKKYDANSFSASELGRHTLSMILSSAEVQAKINDTKKNNNTFNSSRQEDDFYEKIISVYPDTKRQYRSALYPYACDFYIPSLDMYIELNYFWTHNDHPYDKNSPNDNRIVETWKSKHSKFYDGAINTWTHTDVKKYECAKMNNLNYVVLYSPKEASIFINNLCHH